MAPISTDEDTDSDTVVLPGIECFEDDTPSDTTATVRFDNGVRLRYRFTADGRAYEEVFPPDEFLSDDPNPSACHDWTRIHETESTTNAAEELVDTLIEYEAYRDSEGYEQLRGDWGRDIADAIAGVKGDENR